MKPDAVIEVRFKRSQEGGRRGPIIIGDVAYGCVLIVEEQAFDCRILAANRTLKLGETYQLPVEFLNPQLALPAISIDKPVKLWEGKDIATGKVVGLL